MEQIAILTSELEQGLRLEEMIRRERPDLRIQGVGTRSHIVAKADFTFRAEVVFSTWFVPVLTREELSEFLPNLKALFYVGGTTRYFAKPYHDSGIRVFSALNANSIAVAEFTTAQIILANKGYHRSVRAYRQPLWRFSFNRARKHAAKRKGNYQAKVGIVGCGRIGQIVASKLRDFDMELMGADPNLETARFRELGIEKVSLEKLFSECDVISLHLPDTTQTKGLIDFDLLSLMKPYSTLINTGRGAQLVEKDVVKMNWRRKDVVFLLDVSRREPVWPWSPFLLFNQVFLSPHISGSLGAEEGRLVSDMLCSYEDFRSGVNNISEQSWTRTLKST